MIALTKTAASLMALCVAACGRHDASERASTAEATPSVVGSVTAAATANAAIEPPSGNAIPKTDGTVLRLFVGGDVSFGRGVGQRVLGDPEFQPFGALAPWLDASDLRLVNLESVLSEQGGVTVHPQNPLVFSGPPAAASSLRRAHIDAVSVANNHAWDYGKKGLSESLGILSDAGIATAGANMERRPYQAVTLNVGDVKVAFLAFTQVWNDGNLEEHAARRFVAGSDYEAMKRALRRARREHDLVIVSLHTSNEYVPLPRERARKFARALIVSGADLVFGHHPHVLQGLEWVSDRPILYSLGNLVFDSHQTRPETEQSAVALLDLRRTDGGFEVSQLRLCPVVLEDGVPRPLMWQAFEETVVRLSKTLGGVKTAREDASGCALVEQSDEPLAYWARRGFAPNPRDPHDLGK